MIALRARLFAIVCTMAIAGAMLDGCLIDCHGMMSASRSDAEGHCHATTDAAGNAWQSTARCDHQHALAPTESSLARFDPAPHGLLLAAVVGNALPARAPTPFIAKAGAAASPQPPSAFANPLRL